MPALPANSPAHRILNDVFGYSSFRTGQEEVINNILDGISVLTVMPTGSGKSLCFQIPALVRVGLTVVVSPLVALMEDQVAALTVRRRLQLFISRSRLHWNSLPTVST